MKDSYKVNVISQILEEMEKDEYYLAQLRSSNTKNINLDQSALKLLSAYYSGRINDSDMEKFHCR